MATQNKITEMIAAIKTIYPYYAKEANVAALVKTWAALLKDFPDTAVDAAFYKCLQTCKMPPTPADVIENLRALQEATEPTDEELWNSLIIALRETERYRYYFRFTAIEANGKTQGENARQKAKEIWLALPERLKAYIGSEGELTRMAENYTDEELKFEKTRFLKAMPTIKRREEAKSIISFLENSSGVAYGRLEGAKE